MAQLDVYPAPVARSFDFDFRPDDNAAATTTATNIATTATNITTIAIPTTHGPDDGPDVTFSGLPPLHRGHPDVHVRAGVLRAFAGQEPDCERAFFVADLSVVHAQYERWTRCLPGIDPFFAVKSNPDPYVLRLLAGLGTGFDCASHGEISSVLALGVDPSRIIFANPCKPASFVRAAARAGVDTMTFDNADELHKIARVHPGAKLIVRILTDDSGALCQLSRKFGASLEAVPGLLGIARGLGLEVIGVSFHVGSGCGDENAFMDAVGRARRAWEMGRRAGYRFEVLDVGGGFEDGSFERMARVLREAVDVYFPERGSEGVRVIAEPGRFFVSRAFTLAANVIARRGGEEGDSEKSRDMYYINDGVYGSFNCILFDHQVVQPYVVTLDKSFMSEMGLAREKMAGSSVWGPTCDSIDCVCAEVRLPVRLAVGDWLGFRNMGAYTTTAASQFNGFEMSSVVYTSGVEGGAVRRALAGV